MILIDAVYINNSGGKVLLDYLIEQLEKSDLEIYYLLDKRIENNHPVIKSGNKIEYIKGGLITKHLFYRSKRDYFSKILCFGNFPPDIRMSGIVYTYFHQLLFINAPSELSFYIRFLLKLKVKVLEWSLSNSDFWLVQSDTVRKGLINRFKHIVDSKVITLPFYPPLTGRHEVVRVKSSFLYVSTGHAYKNHERLLQAFVLFYNQNKMGELQLTVSNEFDDLQKKIKQLQVLGYPIINHGTIKRDNLAAIYPSAEFVVYPSQAESFGLGIVEAIENGCKIIGSDLPWLYAVCEPSLVFDPSSAESIYLALQESIAGNIKDSRQLVFDKVEEMINLLK